MTGPLHSFTAKIRHSDRDAVCGRRPGAVSLAAINGGTLAAAGGIASIAIAGTVSDATVLSGANLGSRWPTRRSRLRRRLLWGRVHPEAEDWRRRQRLVCLAPVLIRRVARSHWIPFLESDCRRRCQCVRLDRHRRRFDSTTRFVAGAFGKARIPRPVIPSDRPAF